MPDGLLTERRLTWYAAAAALCCALLTAWLWPSMHSGKAGEHCLDFNWIWLTGKLASQHHAAQIYEPASPLPPEAAVLPEFHCAGTVGDGRFDYPPTILFFTYPLGFFSYYAAQVVWNTATLALYLGAVWAILRRWGAVFAAMTTYPFALNILIGHNGFVTAGLFGFALVFMDRRPWLAGAFLGLLTYKPQFGILFPLALLASRNWRAFVSASIASIAFGAAAALAFGHTLWPSFLMGLTEEATRLSDHQAVSAIIFPTIRGILRDQNLSAGTAWTVQGIVLAAIVAAICALWYRPVPHALKAAALCIGTLASAPYALSYDYCILTMAVAFVVRDGLDRGFTPGEQSVLLAGWVGISLFAFITALTVGALDRGLFGKGVLYILLAVVPLLVCAALLSIVVRRAIRDRAAACTSRPRWAAASDRV